ncbi:MAG: type II toxin-antitoxin system RelE/ParE family toxin [Rhizobiaceae bacterium]|nr:type II toxin-antitoxin system RelE/ParE family toxin [Rhizobiaceae bacterium]
MGNVYVTNISNDQTCVYVTEVGKTPFGDWFNRLDTAAALKVRTALARIEAGNLGDVKSVGQGVSERRITFGPGYRVYFGKDGDTLVILLCGGTKRRQSKDIEQAKAFWDDYKARKRKGD